MRTSSRFITPILSAISNAQKRTYATRSLTRSAISEDIARKKAETILEEFDSHPARKHEFFDYLQQNSKGEGITPEQFSVFRDNFFYRTQRTIISVATHATKAIENSDFKALANIAKNFSDEGGHGNPEEVHLKLLETSHNEHGKRVFGVPSIRIADSKNSPYITEEVKKFSQTQRKLFSSSYPTMTGCLLAHEAAADDMLINFRKGVFDPYKGYYTEDQYKNLMKYFDAHRDDSKEGGDVEAQHKEQALEVATSMIIHNKRAEGLIRAGGLKFLEAQNNLWTGMMERMEWSRLNGPRVPPKSEFLTVEQEKLQNTTKPATQAQKLGGSPKTEREIS